MLLSYRVFADVVTNHMTSAVDSCYGTANSSCDANNFSYPAVPFTREHFHQPPCQILDYDNGTEVSIKLKFFGIRLVKIGEAYKLNHFKCILKLCNM